MALDIETLNLAGEALKMAFPEGYLVDPQLSTIKLNFPVYRSQIESRIFARMNYLDELIRKIPGQQNFGRMRDFVYFVLHNPGTTVDPQNPQVWAEIKDEILITLLARLGLREKKRKEEVQRQEAAIQAAPFEENMKRLLDFVDQFKALEAKQKEDKDRVPPIHTDSPFAPPRAAAALKAPAVTPPKTPSQVKQPPQP